MRRRERQAVKRRWGLDAQIRREATWWGWLVWLNAVLEGAYPKADLETGC